MSERSSSGHDDEALTEQFLLHLRGRGVKPNLDELSPDDRERVQRLFDVIEALADRDTEARALEEDPVALRLGLASAVDGSNTSAEEETPDSSNADRVARALQSVVSQHGPYVDMSDNPAWAASTPPGLLAFAECSTLGEVLAVCVGDVNQWAAEPSQLGAFLFQHPEISSVGVVSENGGAAVVFGPSHVVATVHPLEGWLEPGAGLVVEPPSVALGRYFERCAPQWDRVATLDELVSVGDVHEDALVASVSALGNAAAAKPRLAHKKAAVAAIRDVDPRRLASIIVRVQAGDLGSEDAADEAAALMDMDIQ